MPMGRLSGKRVLVTLPLDEEQKEDFSKLIEDAGGCASFIREHDVMACDIAGTSVIIGNIPAHLLHAPASLEWLQTSSAGYDHYLAEGRLSPHTLLTNATGAYGQAVSEHMLASLLCLMKKLHLYRDNQRSGLWMDEGSVETLVGSKILVLGTGDIGSSFARLATVLGAHVFGVRRNTGHCPAPFEGVYPIESVPGILGGFDVVACVLPSSPETRGLADAAFFSAMKDGAFFVNAGRGDLVDSDDLAASLASGHLAGAALDVTSPEPLPADHPLWGMPNALITPHVAGFWHLQATTDNVVAICRSNLVSYLDGVSLENVVAR